jgi:hypothetical protein
MVECLCQTLLVILFRAGLHADITRNALSVDRRRFSEGQFAACDVVLRFSLLPLRLLQMCQPQLGTPQGIGLEVLANELASDLNSGKINPGWHAAD